MLVLKAVIMMSDAAYSWHVTWHVCCLCVTCHEWNVTLCHNTRRIPPGVVTQRPRHPLVSSFDCYYDVIRQSNGGVHEVTWQHWSPLGVANNCQVLQSTHFQFWLQLQSSCCASKNNFWLRQEPKMSRCLCVCPWHSSNNEFQQHSKESLGILGQASKQVSSRESSRES